MLVLKNEPFLINHDRNVWIGEGGKKVNRDVIFVFLFSAFRIDHKVKLKSLVLRWTKLGRLQTGILGLGIRVGEIFGKIFDHVLILELVLLGTGDATVLLHGAIRRRS